MNSDLLDQISVRIPCKQSWDTMQGNEQKRFCEHCRQHVYNISAMRREDALTLIHSPERVCVRFFRRSDGTIVTRDCRKVLRAMRRQFATAVALVVSLGFALLGSVGWASMQRFRFDRREMRQGARIMGDVAPPVAGNLMPRPDNHVVQGEFCMPPALMGKPQVLPPVKSP